MLCLKALLVVVLASQVGNPEHARIGEVEFFGAGGVDLDKIRESLPLGEGDSIDLEAFPTVKADLDRAIERLTGRPPTDVGLVCCDARRQWIIFIGLSGGAPHHRPRPTGDSRLPPESLQLYDRFMTALTAAVKQGAGPEDRSQGYALAADAPLRPIQLEMRAHALDKSDLLIEVLETASSDRDRAAAAHLLGYAEQSARQVDALASGAFDPDSAVRNNATRALVVLVHSQSANAQKTPVEPFVELLLSGTWTDVNKGTSLLAALAAGGDGATLDALRRPEVESRLREIARWRTGHAQPAKMLLEKLSRPNTSGEPGADGK